MAGGTRNPEEGRARTRSRVLDPLARTAFRGAYALARVYWFVRRPKTYGVFVGVWHQGRVLLVQNSYKYSLAMPGGGLKPGEPLAEAGARELREETGFQVDASALRPVFEFTGTQEYKEDHVHFLELDVDTPPALALDNREVVWADFIELDTALRLPVAYHVRAYLEDARRRRT